MAGQAFGKCLLLFDRVLVERSAAKTVAKGGMMLPETSQGKALRATVVAVGSGSKGKGGESQPVNVKARDGVLLPEYGGTKVVLDDKDYVLFRDGDVLECMWTEIIVEMMSHEATHSADILNYFNM